MPARRANDPLHIRRATLPIAADLASEALAHEHDSRPPRLKITELHRQGAQRREDDLDSRRTDQARRAADELFLEFGPRRVVALPSAERLDRLPCASPVAREADVRQSIQRLDDGQQIGSAAAARRRIA